jgi:hypothetical protein
LAWKPTSSSVGAVRVRAEADPQYP